MDQQVIHELASIYATEKLRTFIEKTERNTPTDKEKIQKEVSRFKEYYDTALLTLSQND